MPGKKNNKAVLTFRAPAIIYMKSLDLGDRVWDVSTNMKTGSPIDQIVMDLPQSQQ